MPIGLAGQSIRIVQQQRGLEIFGLRHLERQPEASGEPARRRRHGPDACGVMTRRVIGRPARGPASRASQPSLVGVVADPGIDEGPAVAVVDGVDVDVIEPETEAASGPTGFRARSRSFRRNRAGRAPDGRGRSVSAALSPLRAARRHPPSAYPAGCVALNPGTGATATSRQTHGRTVDDGSMPRSGFIRCHRA